jgi:acetyl esterase
MKEIILIILCCICKVAVANAQACNSGKLDPRVEAVLKDSIIKDLTSKLDRISVEQVKNDNLKAESSYPQNDVQDIKITSNNIHVLVYNATHGKSLPVIIYYHPGGFVTPLLPWMEHDFWKASLDYNAIVFGVDYRVAHESKYPAAVNDAYGAFKWITEHGQEFGGDTSKIVVFGLSAGANLSTVVCQKAKKDGLVNKIKLQVLNCPSVDNARHNPKYSSYRKFATGYFLTKEFMLFAQKLYAGEKNLNHPEVSPLLAKNLKGLPPAIMITAEFDILHDEDAVYAKRLQAAGVKVWYKCFPGQIHCLVGLPADANEFNELKNLVLTGMKETILK